MGCESLTRGDCGSTVYFRMRIGSNSRFTTSERPGDRDWLGAGV